MLRVMRLLACILPGLELGGCGGASGPSAPPPPGPDFTVSVAPTSLTAIAGGASGAATVSIAAIRGFSGTVSVAIAGLPSGATTNPASPFTVSADAGQEFTIATSEATPTGTISLTLHATSGSLSHDTHIDLTTGPIIQTSQVGTMLYLQSRADGHTARIGLDTARGGAIVEVSLDGTNFANGDGTGSEVQPALYDGADRYPDTCTGYGWDPVLAGDGYGHGSPVLSEQIGADSLYVQTNPLEWCPDDLGGGPSMPVPTDMTFEQTISVVPTAPLAFKVHNRMVHNGSDTHFNSGQEFPAVYTPAAYTSIVYYGGTSPWTRAPTSRVAVPTGSRALSAHAPEHWAALVDANGQGLSVYVPGTYPGWTAISYPQAGPGTVYMTPSSVMTIAPQAVIEGDFFLIPGDPANARNVVYGLHDSLPAADVAMPLANLDTPGVNATIAGNSVSLNGWAFDNVAVAAVTIYVDGIMKGTATLGGARPDIVSFFESLAPPVDCGWNYVLDSTTLTNGAHEIVVHVTDTSANEAILAPVPVTVSN